MCQGQRSQGSMPFHQGHSEGRGIGRGAPNSVSLYFYYISSAQGCPSAGFCMTFIYFW